MDDEQWDDAADEQGYAPADLQKSAAEKLAAKVPLACGTAWTAAEILHWAGHHPSGAMMGGGTVLTAALCGWASARWDGIPRQMPVWVVLSGGWLSAAVAAGPLSGMPHPPLTIAAAAITLLAWWKARNHSAVLDARDWRARRADWLDRSRRWGLGGSHLLDFELTRLGEIYTISTRGTRKRASAIARSSELAELIAEEEGLPPSRVRIRRGRIAGRAAISIRRVDPWKNPLFHPLVEEEPQISLPVPCSVLDPVPVGQDPELGHALTLPLFDRFGGRNVGIISIKGGGKGVLLDNVSERVTAARDAIQIRVNLSDKGEAEIESWGPSCYLTAFGPHQAGRAVKVLRIVGKVIAWRTRNYKRGVYRPNPADPGIVIILDESDSAMKFQAVREALENLATKGREYGVAIVHAGQRGTADYTSAKIRSQDDVLVVGKVSRDSEVYHAAGNAGFDLPNMAEYGEGAPGVWAIALHGGGSQRGRAWVFADDEADHAAEAALIAEERAFSQPDLPAACKEHLGEELEELLRTDVFATWAAIRMQNEGTPPAPAPQAAEPAEPDSGMAPAPAGVVTLTEDDVITAHDWKVDMDPDTARRLAALDAQLGSVAESIKETSALPRPPQVSREAMAASADARWKQAGARTWSKMTTEQRERLLGLLSGENGTTITAVAAAFEVTTWKARLFLDGARSQSLARVEGTGRGSHWLKTDPGDGQ